MSSTETTRKNRLSDLMEKVREHAYACRRQAATGGVGLLALVMGYGVIFGHNGVTMFLHKQKEERTLQKQMQDLQLENDRLREHVDRLQNDPGAIEHQAREELHYTRAGEVIVTLPANPNTTDSK
jgi:cell division protein FtsB